MEFFYALYISFHLYESVCLSDGVEKAIFLLRTQMEVHEANFRGLFSILFVSSILLGWNGFIMNGAKLLWWNRRDIEVREGERGREKKGKRERDG